MIQRLPQSALDPAGPAAERIAALWDFAFWSAAVVYVVVIAALLYAAFHRARPPAVSVVDRDPRTERRLLLAVSGATAATIVILVVFFVVDLGVTGAVANPGTMHEHSTVSRTRHEAPAGALRVKVTGYQWWWKIEYLDSVPSRRVTTANELVVPVGRPVAIELESGDVIHSFWVPALHGKRDLVPGRTTRLTIEASRPGVYRGECAEFCGHQHAKMALHVVAQPAAAFARWYEEQLAPASVPADSLRRAGMDVFLGKTCAMCHNIAGLPASGQVAPDLTHLASRRTIAAGVLPNTKGHLAGWILDPQGIKPGAKMPPNGLSPDELDAILAFLGGLR